MRHAAGIVAPPPVDAPKPVAVDRHQLAAAERRGRPGPRQRRIDWHKVARRRLRERSGWTSLSEWSGSLLMATFVSAIASVVGLVIASDGLDSNWLGWGPSFAWMYLTMLAGSWSILTISKRWEAYAEEPAMLRFVHLVAGLGLGAFSYLMAAWLMVKPPYVVQLSRGAFRHLPDGLYAVDGFPTLFGFLGYFATLMVLVRWWKLADPIRPSRLSVRSTALVLLFAVVWHHCVPFPQGMLLAVGMAVTAQMASPWISEEERDDIRHLAAQEEGNPCTGVI